MDTFAVYWEQIGYKGPLSREEEHKLAVRKEAGDAEAREQLIRSHLPWVIRMATRLTAKRPHELDDAIGWGNVGLIRAVDRFNPDRGTRLSTYASWWIRQAIWSALTKTNSIVRVPSYVQKQLGNGKPPHKFAPYARQAMRPVFSLDTTGPDGSQLWRDTLVAADRDPLPSRPISRAQSKWLRTALRGLSWRTRAVIIRRLRLQTLREIGDRFGIIPERARQILDAGYAKLQQRYFEQVPLEEE